MFTPVFGGSVNGEPQQVRRSTAIISYCNVHKSHTASVAGERGRVPLYSIAKKLRAKANGTMLLQVGWVGKINTETFSLRRHTVVVIYLWWKSIGVYIRLSVEIIIKYIVYYTGCVSALTLLRHRVPDDVIQWTSYRWPVNYDIFLFVIVGNSTFLPSLFFTRNH